MITKLISQKEELHRTWLVVLELLGTLNPSPTRYNDTPNEFRKLNDYVRVSLDTGLLKPEHAALECNNYSSHYAFITEVVYLKCLKYLT